MSIVGRLVDAFVAGSAAQHVSRWAKPSPRVVSEAVIAHWFRRDGVLVELCGIAFSEYARKSMRNQVAIRLAAPA